MLSFSPHAPFSDSHFCWLVFEVIGLVAQGPVLVSPRSPLCTEENLTPLWRTPAGLTSCFASVSMRPDEEGTGGLDSAHLFLFLFLDTRHRSEVLGFVGQ